MFDNVLFTVAYDLFMKAPLGITAAFTVALLVARFQYQKSAS